jgi:DNA-directed RNA polymerase subunit RPC12/RpoP
MKKRHKSQGHREDEAKRCPECGHKAMFTGRICKLCVDEQEAWIKRQLSRVRGR